MIGISLGPEGDLIEHINSISEEFDFIEFGIGEHERPVEEIESEKVRKALEDKDFEITVHLPFKQPLSTSVPEINEGLLNYHERMMKFAKQLGAEKVVAHADMRYDDAEDEIEKLPEQIEKLDKLGEKHGVEVCFENLGQWRGLELFELGPLLEELNVSMCFDTGHAFSEAGQEETEEFLEEYSHLISHLHLTDTREGRDMHLPLGSSEIEFQPLIDRLEDFEGTWCMEIFTEDNDYQLLSKQKLEGWFNEA